MDYLLFSKTFFENIRKFSGVRGLRPRTPYKADRQKCSPHIENPGAAAEHRNLLGLLVHYFLYIEYRIRWLAASSLNI